MLIILASFAVVGYFAYKNYKSNVRMTTQSTSLPTSLVTPTPKSNVATPSPKRIIPKATAAPLIDCIGPDGKHAKATQADCDNLNSFWRNQGQSVQTNSSSTSNSQTTTTPVSTQSNQLGYTFSVDSINITIKNDWNEVTVFTFTSTGSTSFEFAGTPVYQGGIDWSAASGSNFSGQVITEGLQVAPNVPAGVYQGTMTFTDETKNLTKTFPTTITVTD
jgi:hypothetical protein